jgi:dihydroneopterin aldolase
VDRILMQGMAFFGRHGVFPAERELGARFTVDVELEADLAAAGAGDRLEDTVNYALAYDLVREVVEGEPCHLLEAVAERIAGRLLELPRVERATVRVHKKPPLEGEFRSFGVELVRSRT